MESARKKLRKNPIDPQWIPAESTFLMGLSSENSSICRAFGEPAIHPLSELQLVKLIFQFVQLPDELKRFQIPKEDNRDEDGTILPKMIDTNNLLIFYHKEWDYALCCYNAEDEHPYELTKIYFDIYNNLYTVHIFSKSPDYDHKNTYKSLSKAINSIRYIAGI
jgi:hypothetical protein